MSTGDDLTTKATGSAGERYICFSIGKEEFGIPLLAIKEVIAIPEVTPIPFSPPYFLGIMNLRGQVISVLDLRLKLGIKPVAGSETAVIICDLSPIVLGVVVDSINSVISPKQSEISEKPEIGTGKNSEYITGVYRRDKELILLLDIAKSLNLDDLKAVHAQLKKSA